MAPTNIILTIVDISYAKSRDIHQGVMSIHKIDLKLRIKNDISHGPVS